MRYGCASELENPLGCAALKRMSAAAAPSMWSTDFLIVATGVFLEAGFTHVLSGRNFTAGDAWGLGVVRRLEFK